MTCYIRKIKFIYYVILFLIFSSAAFSMRETCAWEMKIHPYGSPSETLEIIGMLTSHGYKPIIAYMERNFNITGRMVGVLIQSGALIQINAFSLEDERDEQIKCRAMKFLKNRDAHFVGSDAHSSHYRPTNLESGEKYILDHCDEECARAVLYDNAERLIFVEEKG